MGEISGGGISVDQVRGMIAGATANLATSDQVASAVAGLASTTSVQAMIASATNGLASSTGVTDAINAATSGLATSAALTTLANAVPAMATAAPPGVADAGAQGDVKRYATENHTHASKARKSRVAVTAATYTWVYPTPFPTGVIPICNGIAQTAAGVTDLYNVQIEGQPTNTQCVFRITRYQQSVATLLGITVLALNTTPGPITLHMSALEP